MMKSLLVLDDPTDIEPLTKITNSILSKYPYSIASGFLTKTYDIFSNESYKSLCGWGPKGDTIIIFNIPEFSKEVLPRYFKHRNFQSFVRQLHMYNFHKTVQDPAHGEFKHDYFIRGRPDLLSYIKRKASHSSPISDSKSVSSSSNGCDRCSNKQQLLKDIWGCSNKRTKGNNGEKGKSSQFNEYVVIHEIIRLRGWVNKMEQRVKDLETKNRYLSLTNESLQKEIYTQKIYQNRNQDKIRKLTSYIDNFVHEPKNEVNCLIPSNDRESFNEPKIDANVHNMELCSNNSNIPILPYRLNPMQSIGSTQHFQSSAMDNQSVENEVNGVSSNALEQSILSAPWKYENYPSNHHHFQSYPPPVYKQIPLCDSENSTSHFISNKAEKRNDDASLSGIDIESEYESGISNLEAPLPFSFSDELELLLSPED
mmetsp:Transcript_10200/g.14446  ORF Transcript_10200/g.14446 Transcript_10200/m.14446 type:complete len:426 (+) Transcript_10200:111-1388(+)